MALSTSTGQGGISVGIDDQLFKEDGTLITKIDNMLLKVAALIATPLVHEDDETYDRAYRTLIRAGSSLSLVGAVFLSSYGILLPTLCTAYPLSLWLISIKETCNGRGSTTAWNNKRDSLISLLGVMGLTLVLPPTGALLLGAAMGSAICWFLASITSVVFVTQYVSRLGAPPPKRRKAWSRKLAWHH